MIAFGPVPGFICCNFPAHDLNFHGREGDEIKSKQASKRDRTFTIILFEKSCKKLKCEIESAEMLDNVIDSITYPIHQCHPLLGIRLQQS